MQAMLKSELARAAGVSRDTFRKWLQQERNFLRSAGVLPRSHLLPPQAVKHMCDKYCIILDDEPP